MTSGETDPKRLVNSNRLHIKAEMSDSVTCDDFDEEFDEFGETYDEIGSQPPRQQQFYQTPHRNHRTSRNHSFQPLYVEGLSLQVFSDLIHHP